MVAKHPYVLVIIDIQNNFMMPEYDGILMKIKKMINDAIRDTAYIVFAHYGKSIVTKEDHPESTVWAMLKLVESYEYVSYVNREHRNKAPVIIPVIDMMSLDERIIKVCGLYTDQCVHDTIRGLLRTLPDTFKIELFADACISYNEKGMYKTKPSFQTMNRLTIIGDINKHFTRPQYGPRWITLAAFICTICLLSIGLLK